jgi:HAD superfamily hydrolase (TIGR01509 family)
MMLDSVLFDLDGLLVDSEPLQFQAYRYAFDQFGIHLSMDDWIRWHSVESSTARWVESQNLDLDVAQLREVKKRYYDTLIVDKLQLKPGARELVEDCAKSLQLALVSASRRESIEACLGKFNLGHHFACYISGNEVARTKPFPDPYLAGLQSLQTTADRAAAVEDSLTGYRSACAAGLTSVVCPDHFIRRPENAFDGADLVVDSLLELNTTHLQRAHAARHQLDSINLGK